MQTPDKPVKTRGKFDQEFKIEALRMVSEGHPSSYITCSVNVTGPPFMFMSW